MYHQTRRQGLPGNYNHALLTGLFHVQSSRWGPVQSGTYQSGLEDRFSIHEFCNSICNQDVEVHENVYRLIGITLEANVETGEDELARLLDDETRQPITYNYYYTLNIQNARDDTKLRTGHFVPWRKENRIRWMVAQLPRSNCRRMWSIINDRRRKHTDED